MDISRQGATSHEPTYHPKVSPQQSRPGETDIRLRAVHKKKNSKRERGERQLLEQKKRKKG